MMNEKESPSDHHLSNDINKHSPPTSSCKSSSPLTQQKQSPLITTTEEEFERYLFGLFFPSSLSLHIAFTN